MTAPALVRQSIALSLLSIACGHRQAAPAHPPSEAIPVASPHRIAETPRVSFYGVRTADGARLTDAALLEELAGVDVVCAGESHDDPAHHAVQLAILAHLANRAPYAGRELALGLEMFQRPYQDVLDAYARFAADEATLLSRSEWDRRWGFDFSMYRPLLELSRSAGVRLLALNAAAELTRKVARSGLSALSPADRRALPELVLDDREHRAFFDAAMAGHPMEGRLLDHMYAAQVLWDETMADTAAAFLVGGRGARQMLLIAGNGHCHRNAVVQRIRRRVAVTTASVRATRSSEPETTRSSETPARFDFELVVTDSASP